VERLHFIAKGEPTRRLEPERVGVVAGCERQPTVELGWWMVEFGVSVRCQQRPPRSWHMAPQGRGRLVDQAIATAAAAAAIPAPTKTPTVSGYRAVKRPGRPYIQNHRVQQVYSWKLYDCLHAAGRAGPEHRRGHHLREEAPVDLDEPLAALRAPLLARLVALGRERC
jgi:hypothetical protein